MWPRAEAHGNAACGRAYEHAMGLQCGRGPKPTEIRLRVWSDRPRTPASMWPRAEAHGNTSRPALRLGSSRASMWPRAEAHGNRCPDCGHKRENAASMWPRAEAHGNVLMLTMMASSLFASMWPRAEAHGNHHAPRLVGLGVQASMWPRAEAHGNWSWWTWRRTGGWCFNVAAGRSPRKFQYAHKPGGPVRASMWPRAEAHGNVHAIHREAECIKLQCGRGPKPTEIPSESGNLWTHLVLQCGRGPKPTEILTEHDLYGQPQGGFNVAAGRSPRKSTMLCRGTR